MTPLERLGLEVVAARLLGSQADGRMLCALIDGKGGVVTNEALAEARRWRRGDKGGTVMAAKVGICLARASLDDLGVEAEIITAPGRGYALPEPGRSAIMARLIEEARR